YKHTQMRQNFGVIMLALVNRQPRVLNLKEMLHYFVEHRQDVILRRTRFQLNKAQQRAHILEGFRIVLSNLDETITIIRGAANREDARRKLIERFALSDDQAQAILNMQLGQLTQLDQKKIQDEYEELLKAIEYLEGILADPRKVLHLIKEDMKRIKKDFGDERRTVIHAAEAEDISIEDLIAEEDMIVTITRDGYIKRLPIDTYRTQGRGGKGVIGLTKKEEDMVEHLFIATTHHMILFFTNAGRVYQLKAYEVPAASRQARGTPIINLIQVERGEQVTATVPVPDWGRGGHLFMCTRNGVVKKTALGEFNTRLSKGIIAINLQRKDELKWVRWTDGSREIILGTHQGLAVRFSEADVRSMGRPAAGVTGVRFKKKGDYVVAMDVCRKGADVLVVSEKGYGKRTPIEEYRFTARGAQGVITLNITETNGSVVTMRVVDADDELLIITAKGVVIRQKIETIRQTGRGAQGVRLIRLDEGDSVRAVARVLKEEEE
ncbi:MAG: DNA gyrase subunit A, partial [Armatimonadetes bacterium]|nr:DNA gyrase subunit A [Armatimonadota bacterium]